MKAGDAGHEEHSTDEKSLLINKKRETGENHERNHLKKSGCPRVLSDDL